MPVKIGAVVVACDASVVQLNEANDVQVFGAEMSMCCFVDVQVVQSIADVIVVVVVSNLVMEVTSSVAECVVMMEAAVVNLNVCVVGPSADCEDYVENDDQVVVNYSVVMASVVVAVIVD